MWICVLALVVGQSGSSGGGSRIGSSSKVWFLSYASSLYQEIKKCVTLLKCVNYVIN